MTRTSIQLGRSNYGAIALLLAVAVALPVMLSDYLPRLGVRIPERIDENIGIIVFDLGIIIDLLILALACFGIAQGGRNRWAGIAAIGVAALPWLLPFII
jgi:hypothetical protein